MRPYAACASLQDTAAGDGFCHLHPKTRLRGSTKLLLAPEHGGQGPGRPASLRAPLGLRSLTHSPLTLQSHGAQCGPGQVSRPLWAAVSPMGQEGPCPQDLAAKGLGEEWGQEQGGGSHSVSSAASGSCKVGSSLASPEGSGILLSPTHCREAPGPGLPSSPFLFSGPLVILPHCRALLGWGACCPARGLPLVPVTDEKTGAARASPTPAGRVSGPPGVPLAGSSPHPDHLVPSSFGLSPCPPSWGRCPACTLTPSIHGCPLPPA